MAQHTFQQDYRAERQVAGEIVVIHQAEGDVVELDDDTAAWIETDSPGTLGGAVSDSEASDPDSGQSDPPDGSEGQQADADGQDGPSQPDDTWTIDAMRDFARERGINLHGAQSKADVLAHIQEAEASRADG